MAPWSGLRPTSRPSRPMARRAGAVAASSLLLALTAIGVLVGGLQLARQHRQEMRSELNDLSTQRGEPPSPRVCQEHDREAMRALLVASHALAGTTTTS